MKEKDFTKLSNDTKVNYKKHLERVCIYQLKKDPQKRNYGQLMLTQIDANASERLLEALNYKPDDTPIKHSRQTWSQINGIRSIICLGIYDQNEKPI